MRQPIDNFLNEHIKAKIKKAFMQGNQFYIEQEEKSEIAKKEQSIAKEKSEKQIQVNHLESQIAAEEAKHDLDPTAYLNLMYLQERRNRLNGQIADCTIKTRQVSDIIPSPNLD
ncbi:hypothetical protein N9Y17_05060 [Gammaproteobacteria bacterium]|nr:hypothetical protein [Gammaproteobacteria bacterium]